jgi:hypothetical protein
MKKYILLADVCFDWSCGEYGNQHIDDIYLGNGEFENDELAKGESERLLKEYCDDRYNVVRYESLAKITIIK